MSENIKTIDNAFDIIDLLDKNEKMGVGELSTSLDLPKTSVHRILKTLHNRKIVIQDDQERYTLGYGMYKYAQGINKHNLLVNCARLPMQEFARKTGETLNLGVLVGDEVIIIHSEEGEYYSLQPMLSANSDLNCSGMGKMFLSQFDNDSLVNYFNQDFKLRTINTLTTLSEYETEKVEILEQRLAYDNEEYEYGLSCIATAIFDNESRIIAALSVSGPTSRLQYKDREYLADMLLETANAIHDDVIQSM
ncbi:MAG: IclR family transcriptional regulator [Erysipelothrix sp.]